MKTLNFTILLPVHSLARKHTTGDYFFARSLSRALERAGHRCGIIARVEQDQIQADDVVIILRGRRPIDEKLGRLRLTWCISHPPSKEWGDFEKSDYFFAASPSLHRKIAARVGQGRTEVMYQAFDSDLMFPAEAAPSNHMAFVGSCRDLHKRPVIGYASGSGFPFKLWGNGWEQTPFAKHWVSGNVPNEHLQQIYGTAGVVLNDHMPRMRRNKLTSNRVFDALACGRPVLTDISEDLPDELAGMVYAYENAETFGDGADRALAENDAMRRTRLDFAHHLRSHHSFDSRAKRIVEVTRQLA